MPVGSLDERTSARLFIWFMTLLFVAIPAVGLYLLITLNPIGITVMVLLGVLQNRFAGESQKCIDFTRKYFHPDKFLKKREFIFED